MIKIVASSKIKTGCLKEALPLYEELVAKTRQESGCLSYELYQELRDDHFFTLIEEWKSLEDLKAHTKTEHFVNIVAQLSKYEKELPVLRLKKIF